MGTGVPRDQIGERIGHALDESIRQSGRWDDAQRIAKPSRIFGGRIPQLARDANRNDPSLRDELFDPWVQFRHHGRLTPLGEFVLAQVTELQEQIVQRVDVLEPETVIQSL